MNTEFKAVQGDITKISDVEAIVNAANKSLLGGGGVDGAIHCAAGLMLLRECIALRGCNTGEAKMTKGYKLPCDYVIHTVGPIWHGGKKRERELLESCYRASLEVAVQNGIRSIAFPSISTGAYHFPVDLAAEIAISTARKFVKENPEAFDVIMWVLFDKNTYEVYEQTLNR